MRAQLLQLCPTLCDNTGWSPPGTSVHGILQARMLEWVAISSSREIFPTQGLNPGFLHCRQTLYHQSHLDWQATWEAVFGRQESDIKVSAGPGSSLSLPASPGPRPSLAVSRDLLLRVSLCPDPVNGDWIHPQPSVISARDA